MRSQTGHLTSPHDHSCTCLDRDESIMQPIWDPISSSGRVVLLDFLAYEREPTGKTFTTPLKSPNPNMYVKFIFPVEVPFNQHKVNQLTWGPAVSVHWEISLIPFTKVKYLWSPTLTSKTVDPHWIHVRPLFLNAKDRQFSAGWPGLSPTENEQKQTLWHRYYTQLLQVQHQFTLSSPGLCRLIQSQTEAGTASQTENGGLAHYVIAAAAVVSHNVKHAWVLAWVASRFAASSCALRFSHFAIVLLFSWTKFFTKAKS